jgi:hypothetical protein
MNELNKLAKGILDMATKVTQSPEFERTSEVLSHLPRDYAAEHRQQIQMEVESRDSIPKESLHRLTSIAESTQLTKDELRRFRADFARLDEEFSDFKRSQQAWFIPWVGIAIGLVALFVSICALYR